MTIKVVDFPIELVPFSSPKTTFRLEWKEISFVRNLSHRISRSIDDHSHIEVNVYPPEHKQHIES